jgi:hypothetical protein
MPTRCVVMALLVTAGLLAPVRAGAAVAPSDVVVGRGGPPVLVTLTASAAGEAVLDLTAAAPGASWAEAGREAAVVSVDVDGEYASDLVVTGPRRTRRGLALGTLPAGRHTLLFRFAGDRSAPRTTLARLTGLRLTVAASGTDAEIVRRHAPVLVGRALAGPFENARTDTPLLAWHETAPGPDPGQRRLVYSAVWSNEDGGTVGPALMARWGRTADLEWTYSVVVGTGGRRVPGTAVYHGPGHRTVPFAGTYSGDHPVLQTCTSNNTLCDAVGGDTVDGAMRFALPADDTRPPRRAREYLMDAHPWTYRVMAEEMLREGRVEYPSDPATPALGDQRTYLYLEVDKDTGPPTAPGSAPGAAVAVRLRGDRRVYRSDHGLPDWSVLRDDPAATTVELPAGTRAADVARIDVVRVPLGTADDGATVTVTDLNRAFLLDAAWRPRPSFAEAHGLSVHIGPAATTATIWARSA